VVNKQFYQVLKGVSLKVTELDKTNKVMIRIRDFIFIIII